jgi:hypothetical protein
MGSTKVKKKLYHKIEITRRVNTATGKCPPRKEEHLL